jgi:hypothetical protein
LATTEFLSEKQWSMREKSGDKEKRYLELWTRVEAEMEKPKVGIKTTQIAVLLCSRIRSDRHHVGGSGFVSISTKCKAKLYFLTFPVGYSVQNIENYDS